MMSPYRAVLVGILIFTATVSGGSPFAGQATPGQNTAALADSALEAQATELASQIRCPVCLNLSIEDSPNQLAREMKDLIREQLAAGKTPEDVRQYFVDKYGEWVLLTPKPKGVNLALWVLPAVALIAGAAVVWFAVRRWVRPPEEMAEDGTSTE